MKIFLEINYQLLRTFFNQLDDICIHIESELKYSIELRKQMKGVAEPHLYYNLGLLFNKISKIQYFKLKKSYIKETESIFSRVKLAIENFELSKISNYEGIREYLKGYI